MTTVTVCLLAKNEQRGIAEWLAFQRVIGFNEIFVYDNGSTDDTAAIVKEIALKEPRIIYNHLPDRPNQRPQPTAYADAIGRCRTDWIAFFDTDEFIVPRKHETVTDYLDSMPANASGVAINWLVFGSAGRVEAGEGLVIDRFTRCAGRPQHMTRMCKSILRPEAIREMHVHAATLATGIYVDSGGHQIEIEGNTKTPALCFDGAQLNHYLLKSREEFLIKKSRGHASRTPEEKTKFTHIDEDFWKRNDVNDGENLGIMQWRDALLTKMREWRVKSSVVPHTQTS